MNWRGMNLKAKRARQLAACSFYNADSELHQKLFRLPRDGMLSLFQFILDLVQAIHQPFKLLRHFAEERRDLGIFKVLEFRNDVVALFAGSHKVNQRFHPHAPQTMMIQALRKHAGKEECIVANMLAHLALTIKRRRGPVDRIGLQNHLAQIAQRASVIVFNFVESFGFAEFGKQVSYVRMNFRAAQAHFTIVAFNYFLEKYLERTGLRNHLITPFPCATLLTPEKRPSRLWHELQQIGEHALV